MGAHVCARRPRALARPRLSTPTLWRLHVVIRDSTTPCTQLRVLASVRSCLGAICAPAPRRLELDRPCASYRQIRSLSNSPSLLITMLAKLWPPAGLSVHEPVALCTRSAPSAQPRWSRCQIINCPAGAVAARHVVGNYGAHRDLPVREQSKGVAALRWRSAPRGQLILSSQWRSCRSGVQHAVFIVGKPKSNFVLAFSKRKTSKIKHSRSRDVPGSPLPW